MIFYTQILYTVASLRIIGPTELGARLLFTRPINNLFSGLVFIPLGFCNLRKETCLVIQDEIPSDPENLYRSGREESDVTPEGKFPPIRVPFKPSAKKHPDPFSERITAEVTPVIRWHIVDFVVFLTTIGSRDEARRQMEDATVGTLFRDLPKLALMDALEGMQAHSEALQASLHERVLNWGIELDSAQLKSINLSHELNTAVLKMSEASAKKRSRHLEGEGEGGYEREHLKGRASGISDMAKKLGVSANVVLGAETARAITENPGQKTIIPGTGGFKDLITVAAAVGETLKAAGEIKDES